MKQTLVLFRLMYFSGFALEKWWNPKFKTKFFLEVERVKIFWFLFYLKWELIIKDTGMAAGHGLILRRVNGRTVSTGWHCVCVLLNVLYVKAFYFHVCKLNNVWCICSVSPELSIVHFLSPGSELASEMDRRYTVCIILSTCTRHLFLVFPLMGLLLLSCRSTQQLHFLLTYSVC